MNKSPKVPKYGLIIFFRSRSRCLQVEKYTINKTIPDISVGKMNPGRALASTVSKEVKHESNNPFAQQG